MKHAENQARTNQVERPDSRQGVVGVAIREGRLLVIRRSQHVSAPGKLCFPGGGVEPREAEPRAVVRELAEELALEVVPVRCLWRSQPHARLGLAWWLMELDASAVPVPEPSEVAECHWLDVEGLFGALDLLDSNRRFLEAWRRGEFRLDGLR